MLPVNREENKSELGHAWLRRELGLRVPMPAIESRLTNGARRTEREEGRSVEYYPRQYAVEPSLIAHLGFALRREPLDLGVLNATFKTMPPHLLEEWVRSQPFGRFPRRAWFLYEELTGRMLDLDDVGPVGYVPALDPAKHLVADRRNSPRHRVINNLLGGRGFCLTVRRTSRLAEQMSLGLDQEVRTLIEEYDPETLERALSYLYTKETRSSFAIEGEVPNPSRTERFVSVLRSASSFLPDEPALVELQGRIVDPRFAAHGWRTMQNFVGQTVAGYQQKVEFLCPRPEDVPGLMDGWMRLFRRLLPGDVDSVATAAMLAFSFVFIHPFEDGNGRIHRFLMHSVLARRRYTPPGVIFPISAAIRREVAAYDRVLETFSKPLFDFVDWEWRNDEVHVTNETADLYRYFDATVLVEYLYDRIADTVRRDLKEELGFVAKFDQASEIVREMIDMPDRRVSLFVRLCMQNGGRLASGKRNLFAEITDEELAQLETAVQAVLPPGPVHSL